MFQVSAEVVGNKKIEIKLVYSGHGAFIPIDHNISVMLRSKNDAIGRVHSQTVHIGTASQPQVGSIQLAEAIIHYAPIFIPVDLEHAQREDANSGKGLLL